MNKRPILSLLGRALIAAFGVLLVLYLSAAGVMRTRWFHATLQRWVTSRIEHLTGTRVELRSFSVRPLIFQMEMRGLILHGSEAPPEAPLLHAQQIVLRINPAALLEGKIEFSRLIADGLDIHIETGPSGAANLPGPEGALAGNLMSFAAGTVVLNHANLFWNDRRIPLDAQAHGVSAVLNRSAAGTYWGGVSASRLQVRTRRWPVPPMAFGAQVNLSGRGLTVNRLSWQSKIVSGTGRLRLHWLPNLGGQATIQARGDAGALARMFGWRAIRGGDFQMQVRAVDAAGKLSASGAMEVHRGVIRNANLAPGPVDVTSDFALNSRQLRLNHFRVDALGGSLSGNGRVVFTKAAPNFGLSGSVQGLAFSSALRAISTGPRMEQLLPYDSTVSGKVQAKWEGAFKGLRTHFALDFASPQRLAPERSPVTGFANGSLDDDEGHLEVSLDEARLQTPHSSLSAQGKLGPSEPGLSLRYATTDFHEFRPFAEYVLGTTHRIPLTLNSKATFVGTLRGGFMRPEIQGHFTAGAFKYHGWAWQGFAARVMASRASVQIASGQLRSGPSVFRFSGAASLKSWQVTPTSSVRLTARADRSPLTGLQDTFGLRYPLAGLISGSINLTGTAASLTGSGSFAVTHGRVYGAPFDELSALVQVAGSVWNVRQISLRAGPGRAAGWAQLDLPSRTFLTQLGGADLPLNLFGQLSGSQLVRASRLRGAASFTLKGGGTFSAPEMGLSLDVHGAGLGGSDVGEFHAYFAFNERQLRGQGRLEGPQGTLHFDSATKTAGEWLTDLRGNFNDLRLDPWIRGLGFSPLQAPVVSTGSFEGSGPLKDLRDFALKARMKTLRTAVSGFSLENAGPVEMSYSHGRFASNRFEMNGPASTRIQLQAAVRPGSSSPLSLDITGDTRASVLELLDPSVRAAGNFTLNVHASGTLRQPSLSGGIGVRNVGLRLASLPVAVAGLNGEIQLEGARAVIKSLGAENGQSAISVSGYTTLGPSPVYDFRASLTHLRFEYPAGFISMLDGNLRLSGSGQGGLLSGDVTVDQTFLSQNFNLLNWIGQMGTATGSLPSSPATGYASKVMLNVHAITAPEVRLSSRELSLVAALDTRVRGTLAHPVMTGDIHIRSGQALLAGNRYQITHGDIVMSNPLETTPVLNIEAQTRVTRYNVTVEVSGPVDSARLSYRSDPPLPTEQILSLLALGYAPQQAMMTSTSHEEFGTLGASALLSQALSSQVSGRVTRLFGVSRIRIDPNMIGPTAAGGARITVEEQVAHDLTITYSTNTEVAQQRDIRVRWDLSSKISLIAERDINGVYGVEVRFRHRFK